LGTVRLTGKLTKQFVEAVERAMRRRQLYLPPGHHHAPLLPTTTLAAVPTDTQGQVISMSRSAWASASVAVSPHRTLMRVQALP